MTLAIVSYPSVMESLFEELAKHLAKAEGPGFAVERCQDPEDVVFYAQLWKRRGRSIVRLDLHGHGDQGRFKLGDGMLFASDGTGYRVAKALAGKLARTAELRLLGCNVANERHPRDPRAFSGKKLLRDLKRIVGARRRVVAPTDYLGPQQWGPSGLNESGEARLRRTR
jgi:hypothetical protein